MKQESNRKTDCLFAPLEALGTFEELSRALEKPGVYAAGDVHRGQSLVVWALSEGVSVAKAVDKDLMGYTNL